MKVLIVLFYLCSSIVLFGQNDSTHSISFDAMNIGFLTYDQVEFNNMTTEEKKAYSASFKKEKLSKEQKKAQKEEQKKYYEQFLERIKNVTVNKQDSVGVLYKDGRFKFGVARMNDPLHYDNGLFLEKKGIEDSHYFVFLNSSSQKEEKVFFKDIKSVQYQRSIVAKKSLDSAFMYTVKEIAFVYKEKPSFGQIIYGNEDYMVVYSRSGTKVSNPNGPAGQTRSLMILNSKGEHVENLISATLLKDKFIEDNLTTLAKYFTNSSAINAHIRNNMEPKVLNNFISLLGDYANSEGFYKQIPVTFKKIEIID